MHSSFLYNLRKHLLVHLSTCAVSVQLSHYYITRVFLWLDLLQKLMLLGQIVKSRGYWCIQCESYQHLFGDLGDRWEQPTTGLTNLNGQKKKAARRAVDRARRSMEDELYRKIDEDGYKKMILMMARDRTEDGRDVKRGAVIKDNYGRLIT